MKIQHLEHKHGGRITDLFSIEHEAQPRGMSTWWFTGRVEWSDGSKSERIEISPICVCVDHSNADAMAECNAVMGKLNDYLAERGAWLERGGWKPKAKAGKQVLS